MTTLRDAAENATAGVPVVRGLEADVERWRDYASTLSAVVHAIAPLAGSEAFKQVAPDTFRADPAYFAHRIAELRQAAHDGKLAKIEAGRALSALDTARAEIESLKRTVVEAYDKLEAADAHTAEAQSALTAAQERIAELVGALKPFATLGQYLIDMGFTTKPDAAEMWGFDVVFLTYGDFRTAARATISPAVKESPND